MASHYLPVQWNAQKRRYDVALGLFVVGYLAIFVGAQRYFFPEGTIETLIIRASGTLAFLLLTIVLTIGPLCRINDRFLPLLYNRRHLGVTTFLIGLVHGVFNLIQFHSLGNAGIFESLFTSNLAYGSLADFPFQVLGFIALLILLVMAITSHDFWLANLGPAFWKRIHMAVYFAYGLLIMHVALGLIQNHRSWIWIAVLSVSAASVIILHLVAAQKNYRAMRLNDRKMKEWILVGPVESIPDLRARIIHCQGESIAVFRDNNKIAAVSNVCRHQHGPLGEGKIIDGCITCPWHGYQYYPHNGQSPPPYTEKIETYRVKIEEGLVYVNPDALPPGTLCDPVSY